MDPNNFVLEISSDEDGDWNDHVRGVSDDGDDCNWFAELFGDGSDEVVVVSESEKPLKKAKLKSCVVDLDDDCVVLDGDPNAPVDVRSDNPGNGDDDSDDVLVVSEKGQVACRDYPHSRHLCIKFPFSSTPNQTHCNQCYCYVCDSLAPCVYWGNGTATTDHCHATDKDEFWILKRKNAKNGYKVDQPVTQPRPFDLQIPPPTVPSHIQTPNPGPIHAPQTPNNFQFSDFASRYRNNLLAARTKLHQNLTTQLAVSAQKKMYNSNSRVQKPVFKRTGTGTGIGSVRVATTANKNMYSSYRGNLGNINTPNVNGMLLRSSKTLQQNPILTLSTVNLPQPPVSNQPNPNFQSSNVNSNHLFGTTRYQQPAKLFPPISIMPQPPSGSSNIGVPAQPSYSFLSKTTPLVDNPVVPNLTRNFSSGNQAPDPVTGHAVDMGFKDYGLGWSAGQDTATRESTNGSSVETGGLCEYRYDWMFDDQPMEPGFTDYSSDSTAFIDTGPIFDFK